MDSSVDLRDSHEVSLARSDYDFEEEERRFHARRSRVSNDAPSRESENSAEKKRSKFAFWSKRKKNKLQEPEELLVRGMVGRFGEEDEDD